MKLYPDEWNDLKRFTSGLISAICIVAAMLLVGMKSFWLFMLSIIVATIIGNLLGPLVYRLLFRSSSGGSPVNENKDENQ